MNRKVKFILMLVGFLLARLVLSAVFPLTVDESYAVAVSRWHSLSYFDHPPLGFALGRMMADLFGTEASFVVRLPYVLLGTASALLLFIATRRAYGKDAAFWTTAWYSVAPFFFVASGHFVLPDGPLNFGLLLCVAVLVPDVFLEQGTIGVRRWLVAGVGLGIAILSKYQAVLFAFSALVFLLSTKAGRRQLATPGPWLAAVLACCGALPVVVWNARHHWASFAFQSGRALSDGGAPIHPLNLVATLVGQAAYVWPLTWLLAMVMIWRGLRSSHSSASRFFATLAIVPILFFDVVALFTRNSLPHWSMSGFLFAFPLVGEWFAQRSRTNARRVRLDFAVAVSVIGLLASTFILQFHTAFLTRAFFRQSPAFDLDWQSLDWTAARRAAPAQAFAGEAFVVAADWAQAAKIAVALGPAVPMVVLPRDPRHFQFVADPRLAFLRSGVFIGVAPLDHWDNREKFYRAELSAARFSIGAPRLLTEKIEGYPVFHLIVMDVSRMGAR